MLCSGGAARRACCGALPAAPVAPPNCLPPRAAVLAACIRRERAPGGCLHSRSSAARRARRHRAAVVAIAGAAAAAPAQKPCPTTTPAQLLASRRVLSAPVMLSAPAEGEQSIFGFVDVRDIVSSFFKAGGCLQRTCCKQHACWLPTACTLAAISMHAAFSVFWRQGVISPPASAHMNALCRFAIAELQGVDLASMKMLQRMLPHGHTCSTTLTNHLLQTVCAIRRAAGRGPGIYEDAAAHAHPGGEGHLLCHAGAERPAHHR